MADKRISQLVERINIANNDVLPIVASGATTTNKVTVSTLQDWMQDNLDVGVTSVGLSMPSAFTVTNSPVTTSGNISVVGAGTVSQYIRGDGSLADFPSISGGGSSVSYYLNGSVSQGTIGGIAYTEMNKVPILGAGTDFTINADGYIASFITDAGDPALLQIPAGNWNFETFLQASSAGGSPSFYIELYKVDSGGTATLIASNSASPELISLGTSIHAYFSALAVPITTLALTDRLAIRYYVVHSGRTITLHTENNTLCQIITTFTTGLTALNGLTAQVQNFATGTSGTDFSISSASTTHTFNLPSASATARGLVTTGTQTFAGTKTFTSTIVANVDLKLPAAGTASTTFIKNIAGSQLTSIGSNGFGFNDSDNIYFSGSNKGGGVFAFSNPGAGRTYTLQNASGTLAFTSDISTAVAGYLPLTGGTLTGALNGTSASFTGGVNLATSSGNVGIGTDTPSGILQVSGTNAAHGTTGIPTIPTLLLFRSTSSASNYAGLEIKTEVVGSNFGLYSNQNGALFYHGGTERMRITASGRVLIGTPPPTESTFQLDVNGTVNFISGTNDITYLRVGNNSARQLLFSNFTNATRLNAGHLINASDSSGTIAFATASVERWRITSTGVFESNGAQTIQTNTGNLTLATAAGNGNIVLSPHGTGRVGIGTSAPNALLEIAANANADPSPVTNPVTFRITDKGTAATGAGDIVNPWGRIQFYSEDLSSGGPSVQAQIATIYNDIFSSASNLVFYTSQIATTGIQERLRITSTGNVLINTTTNAGFRLDVNGTARVTGAATFSSSVTASSLIRSGGTSTQYLMADGSTSTLTNPVTGTGTSGQVAYFNGASTIIGGSSFTYNSSQSNLTIDRSLTTLGNALTISKGSDADQAWLAFKQGGGASGTWRLGYTGDPYDFRINVGTDSSIGTQALRIFLSTQNVVIGTATSDNGAKLQVSGTATFSSNITANAGSLFDANSATLTQDVLTVRGGGSSGNFGFRVEGNNGDDLLFVNALSYNVIMGATGGNVLIGTTTAGASKLRIVGLPTSAAGLSSGDVYNLAGVLMIA